MLQFNEQYIRNYLKPLLVKVLTDMSGVDREHKREPLYFYKILNKIDLDSRDKSNFVRDYFQGIQPASRPFMHDDQAEYRGLFLDELIKQVKIREKLSEMEGVKLAYLPDEEAGRTFGSHAELTRNVNLLALHMAQNFEKHQIREKLAQKGTLTAEMNKKIEDGEVKLVVMKTPEGEEQEMIKTEEELADMAQEQPEAVVTPFLEPGLPEKIDALPIDDKPDETPAPPESKPSTVAEVKADVDNGKASSIRELLMSSGLEVVGEITITGGIATGKVRDVRGQELKVTVNTTLPDYKANKYVFEFLDTGPNRDLAGKQIPVSKNDLPSTFVDEKGRRTAADVFHEHDARGTMIGEKPTPPPTTIPGLYQPPITGEIPAVPGARAVEGKIVPEELPLAAAQQEQVAEIPSYRVKMPPLVVTPGKAAMAGAPQKLTRRRFRIPSRKVAGAPTPEAIAEAKAKTTMEKKRERAERPALQQKPPAVTAAAGPLRAPTARPPRPKMSWPAKFGLGAGGGASALIGAGAWQVATSSPENAEVVLKAVLVCFGLSCIA